MLIKFTALDANRNPLWIDPAEVYAVMSNEPQGTIVLLSDGKGYPLADDPQSVAERLNAARAQLTKKGKT